MVSSASLEGSSFPSQEPATQAEVFAWAFWFFWEGVPMPSDQPAPLTRLVEYYDDYAARRFRKKNGKPVGKRSAQRLASKFRLPLIRAGNATLIDEVAGDARLAEHALHREPQRPRRGRPRLINRG